MKLQFGRVFISSLLLAACQHPKFEEARQAIINGVASDASDDTAVGLAIFGRNGGFMGACSGVLVAENLVMTARHCVSATAQGGISCDIDGFPLAGGDVLSDYAASTLKVLVGPTATFDFAASGTMVVHNDATNLCNNDMAFIVLDTKITTAPLAQLRLDTPPALDEMLRVVGWGQSNNSNGIQRRRRADVPVELVGPDTNGFGRTVGPNEFGVGEAICEGDSGGPAFDQTSGAVIGVVSRGGNGAPYNPNTDPAYTPCVNSGPYQAFNIYTRTDGMKPLVLQAFTAAGTEPWVEGGPDPRKAKFGEACTADADCRSAVCDTGMCSQLCDPAADACPDIFVCQAAADGSRNVCGQPPKKGCATAPGGSPAGAPLAVLVVLLGAALSLRRRART